MNGINKSVEGSVPTIKISKENKKTPVTLEEAKRILGSDFFGPDTVGKVFDMELKNIPPIPFSKEEVEAMKGREQIIFYPDTLKDGQPVTVNTLQESFSSKGKDLVEFSDFSAAPKKSVEARGGWAAISKEPIPGASETTWLSQTEAKVKYLKDVVYSGQTMPPEYVEAIKEFETAAAEIEVRMSNIHDRKYIEYATLKHDNGELYTHKRNQHGMPGDLDDEKITNIIRHLKIVELTTERFPEAAVTLLLNKSVNGKEKPRENMTVTGTYDYDDGALCIGRDGGAGLHAGIARYQNNTCDMYLYRRG